MILFLIYETKNKKLYSFPVIIERDEEGWYVGTVPALKSCYTQAKTIPELLKRLQEVAALCLEAEKKKFKTVPNNNEFLGVQKLEFSL
jgi:predicted RNase H-like HicB family nuclease